MEHRHPIAYFSMEIGVDPEMPTYSGGLGVLAGDTIRAASDLCFSAMETRANPSPNFKGWGMTLWSGWEAQCEHVRM